MEKPWGYHGEWSALGSPKAKNRGAAGPKGFGRGTFRCTPFTMIPPRLFHIMSLFRLPGLVKRVFFHWRQTQPVPREQSLHWAPFIWKDSGFGLFQEMTQKTGRKSASWQLALCKKAPPPQYFYEILAVRN